MVDDLGERNVLEVCFARAPVTYASAFMPPLIHTPYTFSYHHHALRIGVIEQAGDRWPGPARGTEAAVEDVTPGC
eukprot:5379992-Heterocapsa_arctica.AAC.1